MEKEKINRHIRQIFFRYPLILLTALIFYYSDIPYKLLLPLTIYPVNFILGFFYDAALAGNRIFFEIIAIEIIPACVAVSAYFLLVMLNLLTPMSIRKRLWSLLFSASLLLIMNIARITALSFMLLSGWAYFDIVHRALWYFLSIFLVAGIWFLTAYIFGIKEIPVYDDFKTVLSNYRKN